MRFPIAAFPEQGLFTLRLIVGLLMLTHGYPKLNMLIDGGVISFPDPFGLGAQFSLILVIFSEFVCSIFLILGFKTRFAAIPLAVTMFTAAFIFNGQNSFAKKELAILYLAVYVTLILAGGGKPAITKE